MSKMFSKLFQKSRITQVRPMTGGDTNILVSRNEKVMVEARRDYYENANIENRNETWLKAGQFTGL